MKKIIVFDQPIFIATLSTAIPYFLSVFWLYRKYNNDMTPREKEIMWGGFTKKTNATLFRLWTVTASLSAVAFLTSWITVCMIINDVSNSNNDNSASQSPVATNEQYVFFIIILLQTIYNVMMITTAKRGFANDSINNNMMLIHDHDGDDDHESFATTNTAALYTAAGNSKSIASGSNCRIAKDTKTTKPRRGSSSSSSSLYNSSSSYTIIFPVIIISSVGIILWALAIAYIWLWSICWKCLLLLASSLSEEILKWSLHFLNLCLVFHGVWWDAIFWWYTWSREVISEYGVSQYGLSMMRAENETNDIFSSNTCTSTLKNDIIHGKRSIYMTHEEENNNTRGYLPRYQEEQDTRIAFESLNFYPYSPNIFTRFLIVPSSSSTSNFGESGDTRYNCYHYW